MSLATVTKISPEWLGEVPTDWQVVGFRSVFVERTEKSGATDVHLTPSQKYGVLPQTEYMAITGSRVVLNLTGANNMKRVQPGDFVSHLRSFQGGLEISKLEGKVSAAYTVITPTMKCSPDYFRYLFKSDAFIQALQSTTDQLRDGQSIRLGELALIEIPFPPVEKQVLIADFLDRETAEIDAFIAESERLIELLNERRTAAITQAVTKGLNPDAPMKDSGIEWLGQVPEHWEVRPAVTLGTILTSTVDKKSYPGQDEVHLCNYTDVYYSDVIDSASGFMEATATHDEIQKFSVIQNDVPFTKDSESSDDVGISSFVSKTLPGVVYGYHLSIFRANKPEYAKFFKYLLDSSYAKADFFIKTPGVTRIGLSQAAMRYLRVPTPPAEEAKQISQFLDDLIRKIDSSVTTAFEAIALARERRQALISAAVTGKIDVRSAL